MWIKHFKHYTILYWRLAKWYWRWFHLLSSLSFSQYNTSYYKYHDPVYLPSQNPGNLTTIIQSVKTELKLQILHKNQGLIENTFLKKLKDSWFTVFQVYIIVIQLYVYLFFFRFFFIIGYYKILSIVPCAIQ